MSRSRVTCLCSVVLLTAATCHECVPQDSAKESTNSRAVPLPKDTLPERLNLTGRRRGLPQPDQAVFPLNPEVVSLGRTLFFSPLLSKDRTVSCASCHRPDHGFASPDPLAVGIGGKRGNRHAPTLLNVALGKTFFWDGRAQSLEEQALKPIENPIEMDRRLDELLADLRSDPDLVERFSRAFRTDGSSEVDVITTKHLATALATFQRTLLSGDSSVDRFRRGEYNALTARQRQGLWLFESRGRCWKCHSGPNFSDGKFHNTGVGFERAERDPGRFAVTRQERDRFAFKTPTLRDVAITGPYMHDGGMKTLRDVVEFYNAGGASDDPHLDRAMQPLGLGDEEIDQLVAFLKALSSSRTTAASPTVTDRPASR